MLALVMLTATTAAAGAAGAGNTVALTLCPTAAEALVFTAAPTAAVAKPLELKAKPGTCIVIGGAPCAGHGCLVEGPCANAPKWKTAPAPGGTGVQVRTGGICIDFFNQDSRLQAYDCCASSACVNQHYEVDAASKTISSTGQGAMAGFKNMSLCMHSIPPPGPPPPPPGPPAPPKSALWCPHFHTIQGHYDPSGPILVDGTWHVFPDGNGKGGGKGWSHFTSKDLLRWTEQSNSTMADGDTGSVSITDGKQVVVLFPDNDTPAGGNVTRALKRQTAVQGKLSLDVTWSMPTVAVDKPDSLGKGMRDPARALQMPDGHWYVGAGSGFGGTGPNANTKTGLPDSGTGCLAWFRAKDASLSSLEYVGCLLENNHTTGHIDPGTVAWKNQDMVAAFFECPDVFPLGDKYVAMASLYNWHAGGYFTNEFFLGTITDNKFKVEDRGLLDYGQYYAARTGGGVPQSPNGRRVLFSATGWHNPPGMGSCKTQLHLIPRDIKLDNKGRITFNPIPEIAQTLRKPGSAAFELSAGAAGRYIDGATTVKGSSLELHLNCSGAANTGTVGLQILAHADKSKYTTVGYDYGAKQLFVDHSNSGAQASTIKQVAPLAGGVQSDGNAVEIVVLVDRGLVESFLNRRAVISSFVSELMAETTPAPAERTVFVAEAPSGVTCTFVGYELMELM
jgi:sucrose-6-phosphate hydrolase SacC (GH32 family)